MSKQIYNYELFTNKKDELRDIQKRRKKRQRIKRFSIGAIVLIVLVVAYILLNSRCEYYSYKEEAKTEDNANVVYKKFASGYLKYSGNGIEYQTVFGKSQWNIAVSFQEPYLSSSDSYAVLGDKGGNTLMLFNESGKVSALTLKYPLVQADVSKQGIVEVILEGENSNFIQVYNKEGELIADMKSSVDETGYPLTAAISPDGTKLAVSYFSIGGMESKTTIAFYDFSQQLQSDNVTLKGGFDYSDFMVPKIQFVDEETVVAFGDSATYYYDTSDEPKELKEVTFDQEIESVFVNKKYIGYILDNSSNMGEKPYRLLLYKKDGTEKLNITLDMNYESINMWDKEIIAVQDNECTILNLSGKILFQGRLNGNSIAMIMPAGGWRTYHVIFEDKIVKMNLRFWGSSTSYRAS